MAPVTPAAARGLLAAVGEAGSDGQALKAVASYGGKFMAGQSGGLTDDGGDGGDDGGNGEGGGRARRRKKRRGEEEAEAGGVVARVIDRCVYVWMCGWVSVGVNWLIHQPDPKAHTLTHEHPTLFLSIG